MGDVDPDVREHPEDVAEAGSEELFDEISEIFNLSATGEVGDADDPTDVTATPEGQVVGDTVETPEVPEVEAAESEAVPVDTPSEEATAVVEPDEVEAEAAVTPTPPVEEIDPRDKMLADMQVRMDAQMEEGKKRDERYLALLEQRAAGEKPEEKPPEKTPYSSVFKFQFPKELAEAVTSGDPALVVQSLEAVASAVADQARQYILENDLPVIQAEAARMAANSVTQTTAQANQGKEVFADFYETYPGYNNENLYLVVQAATKRVAKMWEAGGKNLKTWSPELRDAIGAEVKTTLGFDGKTVAGSQATPAVPVVVPGKGNGAVPPRTITPGARPAGAVASLGDQSLEDEIKETFGLRK